MNNPVLPRKPGTFPQGGRKYGINYYNIKMNKFFAFSIVASFLFSSLKIDGQDIKKLTFDEVIKLSEEQSPNALMAKHRFRASYWQYRSYQAQYLPSLTLSGTTP